MKKNKSIFLVILILSLALASCTGTPPAESTQESQPAVLNVMTHDSFAVSEQVIRDFEQQNNVEINFLLSGDTGAALNRAILTRNSPQADVFFGIDNTFLSRALSEDIFEPYDSPLLADIADGLKLDPGNRLLPVDYGDVCINYDKAYFSERELAVPGTLSDLLKPEYQGLLVVENPATSSPGLAFLMATIAEFGEDGYVDFWEALKANGVVIVNDWETAYYSNFSGSSGRGDQSLVVSYSSSPVAEVIFADQTLTESPTASITSSNSCFRQIEFVGILAGTQQRELAERFVDYMLSPAFQEDIPLQMFVYPANEQARLPGEFAQFTVTPQNPASLPPDLIAANRELWIDTWTNEILR